VVTAPIQTPFYLLDAVSSPLTVSKKPASQAVAEKQRLLSSLENDPGIAFKEGWNLELSPWWEVIIASFSDQKVKYNDDLLEKFHRQYPGLRDSVYCSRGASKEFLVRHFDEEYQRCQNISYTGLANLVSNPNTPLDLVQRVASSNLPFGAIEPARKALAGRRSERPPESSAPVNSAELKQ
jgi:hypothetical protein